MGKANAKGRSRGAFIQVQHGVMKSAAWQDLSGNAVKLLLRLMMLSQGNNGWGHGKAEPGQLFLSERQAAEAIGVSRNTASRAFSELIEHGFLRIVQAGHFDVKVKLATIWRLTFEPYPHTHKGPTNEWRDWRLEQYSRAQILNGSGAKIGPASERQPFTGANIDPDNSENGGNPQSRTGSISDPHIDIPDDTVVRANAPNANPFRYCPQFLDGPIATGRAA